MAEWVHNCKRAGRNLLIPYGEMCDRCGLESPEEPAPLPLRQAAEQALAALQEEAIAYSDPITHVVEARDALKRALANDGMNVPRGGGQQ